jgi:ribosome-associated heat shock protein Hsp15
MQSVSKIRIDKWLWAVRIYKTRALARNACNASKVKINGKSVKPSRHLKIDEVIVIQKGIIKLSYKVKELIEKRTSAKIAQNAYLDITPDEEKFKLKEASSQALSIRDKGMGRPTKKDRREIEKLKWGT